MGTGRSNSAFVKEAWEDLVVSGYRHMNRYFTPDYVRHTGREHLSRDEFRVVLEDLQTGFPDFDFRVVDSIEHEDKVATRWEAPGTHLGTYLGVPATNKSIVASGITISRIADRKFATDWASWNKIDVLHAIGIIPIDVR
jgi:steroid delta-isomerase-like uncharacterized protein